MKKHVKIMALALSLLMVFAVLAACAPTTPAPEATQPPAADTKAPDAAPETPAEAPAEAPKVALILEGAISDMSWNATAYNGLQKIKALGAEVQYTENTPASSVADAIRTFGDEGYDVIFLSTNSYADAGAATAAEYPDTQFFFINSGVIAENASSFAIQDAEQGFLMGALAALLTETKTVGFIGGLEIQPIKNGGKGFAQGVAYVDPSIKILSNNTGSFDDVNAAKELAKSFIGQGADVLAPMANQASLGVMEAAQEGKAKAIGSGLNQETVAPDAAVVAIVKDTSIAYEAAYKAYLEGAISDQVLKMGAAQGVVYIGDYYIEVPAEVKTRMEEIYAELAAGKITITLD